MLMATTDDFDSVDSKVISSNSPSTMGDKFSVAKLRESLLVLIFMIFFVCNRFIRASTRVLKKLMKKGKKNKIKAKEKANKAAPVSIASTTDDDKGKVKVD